MEPKIELDLTEFRKAVELYMTTTQRDLSEILNKWGIDICYRAMRHTPKAEAASLNPLNPETKKGGWRAKKIMHKIATKKGYPKGKGNKAKAIEVFKGRKQSVGFLKAMYLNMIRDLGVSVRARPYGGSAADDSRATKARPNRLIAEIISGNADQEAIDIMMPALQKAFDEKAADRIAWAQKKLAKTAERFSGK